MRRWQGPLWVEGKETTEFDLRRFIDAGVSTWRPLPLTLRAVFTDTGYGHENAEPVATIENVDRQPEGQTNLMIGEGVFAENDAAADRAWNLLGAGGGPRVLRGVSVDPTNGVAVMSYFDRDSGEELETEDDLFEAWMEDRLVVRQAWSQFEVGAATLVATPAFVDAAIEAVEPERSTLVASAAVRDLWRVWDDGEVHKASSAPSVRQMTRLATYLRRNRGETEVVSASAAPSTGAVLRASVAWDDGPPAQFFRQLALDGPTPFTITDEGEVFGHIACWGQCHAGFLAGAFSRCVVPERSPSGYSVFRANRQVRCSDGSRASCGVLTMDTSHAPAGEPGRRPSLATVMRHYENTGLIAAHIAAYDDEFGIQVHGALATGLPVDDVRRCMASAPSGDWRNYGQGLDLAGVLQVNQPGYPQVAVDEGDAYMLTASLSPTPFCREHHAETRTPAPMVTVVDGRCSCSGGHEAASTPFGGRLRRARRLRSLDGEVLGK